MRASLLLRKMSSIANPVEQSIQQKLTSGLSVSHLTIVNESYMHNVPKGAETHFKVVVVSDQFNDLPLIKVSNSYRLHSAY